MTNTYLPAKRGFCAKGKEARSCAVGFLSSNSFNKKSSPYQGGSHDVEKE
ncbi:MAG: hypothetical protein JST81_08730 [Bacteroidetes bacterium]|nr:hypothetical protein [Bacteroidota bacterium]